MTLPHYLKEFRRAIQDAWLHAPSTTPTEVANYEATRKALEKKGAGQNISDAKKFLEDSVGIIVRLLRRENVGKEAKVLGDASQVALANRVFQPTASEIAQATRVVEAARAADAQALGAYQVDGKMVDAPFVARARAVLAEAARFGLIRP